MRPKAELAAHGRQIAVEVGDDAETIVTRELGQECDVLPRVTDRVVDESPRDAIADAVVEIQRGAEAVDQPSDRLVEG